jgi:Domain of unknown function (DUF5979)/Domain of unknown function DUF11
MTNTRQPKASFMEYAMLLWVIRQTIRLLSPNGHSPAAIKSVSDSMIRMTRPLSTGLRGGVGTFATVLFFCAFFSNANAAANLIQNPGFENNPPPVGSFGNHISWSISPWIVGTGQLPNVVKVDGPGGYNYGNLGPESDATAPGSGIEQHYLDIANGVNKFYQSFTVPACPSAQSGTLATVTFGGYFSGRGNAGGTATIQLLNGTGFNGSVIQSLTAVVAPGNSQTDPWINVNGTASLVRGSTFSYVVDMPNPMNFDNAYLTIEADSCEGSLSVTKVVSPDPLGIGNSTQFPMTVTCTNPTLSYSLNVHGNTSTVPTNLPVGSICSVMETLPKPPSGCTWLAPVYSPASVTIAGGMNILTVTNSYTCESQETGCLKDLKVTVKCNPDGTYTVTLSGSGFIGTDITLTSQTPGVRVMPPQQPWAATTTWTISGATPGQLVTLTANATNVGGGSEPGTDQCCSGEIKVVMPECPKPPIDVKVDKENTPSGGQGNGFNVWVTNVGAPITFGPGELTVKDVVPAGLTINTQTSTNWTCNPLPAVGPATITCTYNLAGTLGTNGQLTDSLVFNGVLSNHQQPVTNCAIVSIAANVGIDTNPSNDQACVTVQDAKVGELIFTKHVVYVGPILLPSQPYSVTVTCGSNTTTLNLLDNVPQSIGNIPYGTSCSYVEPTPPVPPNVCPQNKTGVWTTVFAPPSPVTINTTTTNVSVANTLTCADKPSAIDVGIGKTGGTTPYCPAPYYSFSLTVTNVGSGFPGTNNIVVTDVVPNGLRFDSATGTNWTCATLPANAGSTVTCNYTGPAPTLGQVLPVITVGVTAMDPAPFPPYTNCAAVALTSGNVDTNAANNNACVTVAKPSSCPVGMPPIVTTCQPPMVPGPVRGQCICGPGTVLVGRECVKQTTCQPPMVPGPVAGQCICGRGYIPRGKGCVKETVCISPAKSNGRGGCDCPEGWTKQGSNKCVKRERSEPRVTPRNVINGIGIIRGLGGGGGGGGGAGPTGGGSPGKR